MSRRRQDINPNSSTSETGKRGIYRHDKPSSSKAIGGRSTGQNTSTGYTPSGDAVMDSSSQSTTTPEEERISPDRMIDDAANSITVLAHSKADTIRTRKSVDTEDMDSNDSGGRDYDPTPSYGLQDNPTTPLHTEGPITRRRANLAPPTPVHKSPGRLPLSRKSRKKIKTEKSSAPITRIRSLPTPSTSGSSGDKESDPQAFANEGVDLWNRRRETWTGGKVFHAVDAKSSKDNAASLAKIKPENYLGIYDSLVYQRKRLARPISLPFVVKILRSGWIRDGLWPSDAPNPATTQTEDGEGEDHDETMEEQPPIEIN